MSLNLPDKPDNSRTGVKENLINEIIQLIATNFSDVDVLKKQIVEKIGKNYGCNRCFLRIYDKKVDDFSPVDIYSEYLSSPEEKSLVNHKFNEELNELIVNDYRHGKAFFIPDVDEFIEKNNIKKNIVDAFKGYFQVKSNYCMPVISNNRLIGALIIHYTREKVRLTPEELELFKTLTNLVVIIIKHIEREKLLRKITSIIRDALDINEMKKYVVSEIGKVFDADRCFLRIFDPEKDRLMPVDEFSAFFAGPEPELEPEYDPCYDPYFIELDNYALEHYKRGVDFHLPDLKTLIKKEGACKKAYEKLFYDLNVKSAYSFSIYCDRKLLGAFLIEFTRKKRLLNEEEIGLLNEIKSHIGVAIRQSNLYQREIEAARRDKLLAKLISIIKSNLDLKEIFSVTADEIKKFYGLEAVEIRRCSKNGARLADKNKSFLQSHISNECLFYGSKRCEIEGCKYNFFDDITFFPEEIKQKIEYENVKQLIGIPIRQSCRNMGTICLFSGSLRNWKKEDIRFLKRIADNIFLAIRNSNLYDKSKFISDVSHELKTPITVIHGYIERFYEKLPKHSGYPEFFYDYLNKINKNVLRASNLIENLLYLDSLEQARGDSAVKFEKTGIFEIMDNVLNSCEQLAQNKNILLEVVYADVVIIKCNSILIEQALVNLIKNAIEYSENNSKIIIRTEISKRKENEVVISVQDFGSGIEKHEINNIFERFYRVDKSRNRERGGSGLGLSIVKRIIELHNGKIEIESKLGQGSTFCIYLPM